MATRIAIRPAAAESLTIADIAPEGQADQGSRIRRVSLGGLPLPPSDRSFFLLGPRGTGKTTWIQENYAGAATHDLLLAAESLRLHGDPGLLRKECLAMPDGA